MLITTFHTLHLKMPQGLFSQKGRDAKSDFAFSMLVGATQRNVAEAGN